RGCGTTRTAGCPSVGFAPVGLRGGISIFSATLRVGATSPCRRPSMAAPTGHEATMTTDIACDNPRSPWTTERVAMLRTYLNAGPSCAQIATETGVARTAVIGKMTRLGLSRGRRTASPGVPRAASSPRRPHVLTQRIALKALFAAEPVVTDVVSPEP